MASNHTVDSILQRIATARHDTMVLKEYTAIGDYLKGSEPDSAIEYFNKVIEYGGTNPTTKDIAQFVAMAHVKIAIEYIYFAAFDKADENIQKATQIAEHFKLKKAYPYITNSRGLLANYQSDYELALELYLLAHEQASKAGLKVYQAKIASNMAIVKYYMGEYNNAIALFKRPVEIAYELQDNDLLAGSLMNLGNVFSNLGELDSSKHYYKLSSDIYKQINDVHSQILCAENLAAIYSSEGKFDLALEMFFEQRHLAQRLKKRVTEGNITHSIADTYLRLGDYESALQYYLEAIKIQESINDKLNLANSLKGLGLFHFTQSNFKLSEYYFNEALKIYREINNPKGIASAFTYLASMPVEDDKIEWAISLYDSAKVIYNQLGDEIALSDLYIHYGELYQEHNILDKAKIYFDKALVLKTEHNDNTSIALIYSHFAQINYKQLNYDKALTWAKMGLKLAKKGDLLAEQVSLVQLIMNCYKKLNETGHALDAANDYITLKDSLYNTSRNEAMIKAEMRWQASRKQQKIEELEQQHIIHQLEIDKKNEQTKRQKSMLLAIGSLLLLSLASIFFVIQIFKRKRDLLYQKQLSSITRLKMQNIQNRISPHFFFNALSSAALPLNNFPEEKKSFDQLVLLLRNCLLNAEKTAVSLQDELAIVDSFIKLHQLSKTSEFKYTLNNQLNGLSQTPIPSMLLQVSVENALKHGLAPKQGEKELRIDCFKKGTRIIISVSDNGIGHRNATAKTAGTGTGSKLLMQTIHLLNKRNHEKIIHRIEDLDTENQTGTKVTIEIPLEYDYSLSN